MTARRRNPLRFLLTFVVAGALFELAFVGWIVNTRWFDSYLVANARISAWFLEHLGTSASSHDRILALERGGIELRRGCDAIEPLGFFLVAIAAFPASWRAKILGAFAGVIVLNLLNSVRIVTLALVKLHRPESFDVMHVDVWPVLFLLVSLLLWILWTLRLVPDRVESAG